MSKLFLKVDLGHADLDEQRKLLRPFRLMPLKHRLFVSFVKLIYRIFNDKAAVEILSRFVPSQRSTVSQYFIQAVIKNDAFKYSFLNISTRMLNSFISARLNKPLVYLERFVLADTTFLYNSAKTFITEFGTTLISFLLLS